MSCYSPLNPQALSRTMFMLLISKNIAYGLFFSWLSSTKFTKSITIFCNLMNFLFFKYGFNEWC